LADLGEEGGVGDEEVEVDVDGRRDATTKKKRKKREVF
jgi:hypothetical protein